MAELLLADKKNWAHSERFEVYEYSHWFPLVRWVYLQRLKMCLRFLGPCGRVLDAGYGDGIALKSLAAVSGEVYGIDVHGCRKIVEEMARKEGFQGRVFLRDAPVGRLPFKKNFFDAVLCISILEHVPDTENATDEIFRVLKKGGRLIVGLPIEGLLTRTAWKVFLKGSVGEHVIKSGEIKKALGKKFTLKGAARMPSRFVPDFLGLYEALLYEK